MSHGVVRPQWQDEVLREGLVYSRSYDNDGQAIDYWREGSFMVFTDEEIQTLHDAAAEVFSMCDELGDWLVETPAAMERMGIPTWAHAAVRDSWSRRRDGEWFGSVYGRFDVSFGGLNHPDPVYRIPKFYEFNADTPTSLVESSVVQWTWFEQTAQGDDQWNGLFESLIVAWDRNLAHLTAVLGHKPVVYFACSAGEPTGEDELNLVHLQDACDKAGYETRLMYIEDVGLGDDGRLYDNSLVYSPQPEHLEVIFKLYPWEDMLTDDFGAAAFTDMANQTTSDGAYGGGTFWIEPPYKLLWSNKALFAWLWERFADDPRSIYLLPTFFADEAPADLEDYVRKPLWGREGANVGIYSNHNPVVLTSGPYLGEQVVQGYHPPPTFYHGVQEEPMHVVCGIWMVDGEPAGLGLRESAGPVTDNAAFFLPHVINYPHTDS